MSSLRQNLIFNFLCKIWNAASAFVFIPYYIGYLGIEAYGLVGFYLTLFSMFAVLDLGLGTSLNRHLSNLYALQRPARDFQDSLLTLEIIYWIIAIFISVIISLCAPILQQQMIHSESLSPHKIHISIITIGIAIGCLWPYSLYAGGLSGMQAQVSLNILVMVIGLLKGLGAILLLSKVSASISTFFLFQIFCNLTQTLLARHILWKKIPRTSKKARFRIRYIKEIKNFAFGLTGISLLVTFLVNIDKIIVSKLLTLEQFSYYSLANLIAGCLNYISSPVFSAFFPILSESVATKNHEKLSRAYHRSTQLISLLCFPIGIMFFFFPKEILNLWCHQRVIVENTYSIVRILVLGTLLNSMMTMPYGLQLATGWTRLTFMQNLFSVIILMPLLYILTNAYGLVGAAYVWLLLNICYIITVIPLMHRRILQKEMKCWYLQSILLPLVGSMLFPVIAYHVGLPWDRWGIYTVIPLMLMTLLSFLTTAFCMPYFRNKFFEYFSKTIVTPLSPHQK